MEYSMNEIEMERIKADILNAKKNRDIELEKINFKIKILHILIFIPFVDVLFIKFKRI